MCGAVLSVTMREKRSDVEVAVHAAWSMLVVMMVLDLGLRESEAGPCTWAKQLRVPSQQVRPGATVMPPPSWGGSVCSERLEVRWW